MRVIEVVRKVVEGEEMGEVEARYGDKELAEIVKKGRCELVIVRWRSQFFLGNTRKSYF